MNLIIFTLEYIEGVNLQNILKINIILTSFPGGKNMYITNSKCGNVQYKNVSDIKLRTPGVEDPTK